MAIDALGEYIQAHGSYYMMVADEKSTAPVGTWIPVDFSGETTGINVTHTAGTSIFTTVYSGIYSINTSISYDVTGNGFASMIGIFIDGTLSAKSNIEAQAESGVTYGRLTLNILTDGTISSGVNIEVKFMSLSGTGTTLRSGVTPTDSFIRILRIR